MDPKNWQRIKLAFTECLDLPSGERALFIDGLSEPTRSEVEKLLANHAKAEGFIESPAAVGLGGGEMADGNIGRRVDDYQIIELIGAGGMGNVYLAEQRTDDLTHRVAIKLIKRGMDTATVLKRFVQERQILANLEHPNIARFLDGGSTDDGLPYFVMEYVDGSPIRQYCEKHQLDVNGRLELFRKVCSAVSFAHQNLTVHRDLKPSNILVTNDGEPKLLDFGIAKLLNPDWSADTTEATLTMLRVMTPEYASPEQIRGETVTTSSDVYSLGVVLYELLTGRRPYKLEKQTPDEIANQIITAQPLRPSSVVADASNFRLATDGDRIRATDNDGFVSETGKYDGDFSEISNRKSDISNLRSDNSDRKPRGSNGDSGDFNGASDTGQAKFFANSKELRGDLDNIVLKALQKEQASRYQSVQEFSDDIRRHMVGLPVSARPDTVAYRAAKFFSRHKAAVSGAAAVALLLISTTGIAVWQAGLANAQREKARQNAADVRTLANSLIFDIHDSIRDLPGATPARKLLVSRALGYLDKLASESQNDMTLQAELADGYEKIGEVQGGSLVANLGDSAGAVDSYNKALAIRQVLAARPESYADKYALAMLHSKIFRVMLQTIDLERAEEHLRPAIAILDQLSIEQPDNSLNTITSARFSLELGELLASKAEPREDEAIQNFEQSIAKAESVIGRSGLDEKMSDGLSLNEKRLSVVQMAYRRLGQNAESMNETAEALEYYEKALLTTKAVVALNEPPKPQALIVLSIGLGNVGRMQAATGDFDPALKNVNEMVAICQRAAQADPQNALAESQLSLAYGSLGYVNRKAGRYQDAIAALDKSREMQEKTHATRPDDIYNAGNLGETLAALGETYEKIAESQAATESVRRKTLIDAKKWHEKSLSLWVDLKNRNKLPAYFAPKIAEQTQAIERCSD